MFFHTVSGGKASGVHYRERRLGQLNGCTSQRTVQQLQRTADRCMEISMECRLCHTLCKPHRDTAEVPEGRATAGCWTHNFALSQHLVEKCSWAGVQPDVSWVMPQKGDLLHVYRALRAALHADKRPKQAIHRCWLFRGVAGSC